MAVAIDERNAELRLLTVKLDIYGELKLRKDNNKDEFEKKAEKGFERTPKRNW